MATRQNPQRRGHNNRPPNPRSKPKGQNQSTQQGAKVRKKGNVIYLVDKTRRRIPWRVIISLIFVFVGATAIAFSYAQIHTVHQEINASEQAIRDMSITNSNLEAQITRSYTREEIEHHARTRLGMGPPDPSQIIYFNVPLHDGVLVSTYAPPIPNTPTGFWQGIVDFFRGLRN